jgi:hypothetical protein
MDRRNKVNAFQVEVYDLLRNLRDTDRDLISGEVLRTLMW